MTRPSGFRNAALLADLRRDRILFILLSAVMTLFGLNGNLMHQLL